MCTIEAELQSHCVVRVAILFHYTESVGVGYRDSTGDSI
jgi:hypothetical protein